MTYRRSVLPCDLKNKTLSISTRRKGTVCKLSVVPSGRRRRNSSRLTTKRRAVCRMTVQHCALRKRQCCRNRSSWRKTLPGQCTELHYPELSFTPTFGLPLLASPSACFATHHTAHLSLCDPSSIELIVGLCLVVRVPRMLSSAVVSKPWRDPSRSWRRGWRPCSSSTSRTAPSCKLNWMKRRLAARLCRERYVLETKSL